MSNESIRESKNHAINVVEQLKTEFHAFNYTESGVVEKEYVRVSDQRNSNVSLSPTIDSAKLVMLLKALENEYVSSLASTRYALYDISFRKTNGKDSIGFSFNDIGDYNYLTPKEIFKPFKEFDINILAETETRIQKALYQSPPQFNPVFMIATLIEKGELIGVKTYTRHDLQENSTTPIRMNLINTVAEAINPNGTKADIYDVSETLEKAGLIFNFVGFDCDINNRKRYKLYFRNYENTKLADIIDVLKDLLCKFKLKHNLDQIETNNNTVWGIAVSTDNFQYVNGIQLYLYP